VGITNGRESNLIGALFSPFVTGSLLEASPGGEGACDFARDGGAVWFVCVAAGFAAAALGDGLCGFTVTFDVMGLGLGGGRVAFLATAALRTAFFGIAFPGFFAALFGFFEGI
jgi:hypothetical protein